MEGSWQLHGSSKYLPYFRPISRPGRNFWKVTRKLPATLPLPSPWIQISQDITRLNTASLLIKIKFEKCFFLRITSFLIDLHGFSHISGYKYFCWISGLSLFYCSFGQITRANLLCSIAYSSIILINYNKLAETAVTIINL